MQISNDHYENQFLHVIAVKSSLNIEYFGIKSGDNFENSRVLMAFSTDEDNIESFSSVEGFFRKNKAFFQLEDVYIQKAQKKTNL